MFRTFRKAAKTLSRDVQTVFSTAPPSHSAHLNKTLKFPTHTVRLGNVFAEGGFSFIHIATPLSGLTSTRFAVKRLPYPSCDSETCRQVDAEITFLTQLPPHPNIVRFHSALKQNDTAFLLFELVDGGTLPDVLSRLRTKPQDKLVSIFADVVSAVAHLHAQSPPVAIRDVKLENILYDRLENRYKLCDFGSSSTFAGRLISHKAIVEAEEEVANSCTAMYQAPELADLYTKSFICERVDVWALGCVWYGMLYGQLPFDGLSRLQICKGLGKIPDEPVYAEECEELCRGMLTVDVAKRWDVFEVLERVRRMQGMEMTGEMREAALRLRRLRKLQMDGEQGIVDGKLGKGEGVAAVFGAGHMMRGSGAGLKGEVGIGSLIDLEDAGANVENNKGSVGGGGMAAGGGDDWADFDSAFGGQALDENDGVGGMEKGKDGGRNEGVGDGGLLIDFGAIAISDGVNRSMARQDLSAKRTGQGRGEGKRKEGGGVGDLIDFG